MALADHAAPVMNIEDRVADFEFQGEVECLRRAEQAVIARQLHAAEAPVLHREGMAIDHDDATVIGAARMAAARGIGIIA